MTSRKMLAVSAIAVMLASCGGKSYRLGGSTEDDSGTEGAGGQGSAPTVPQRAGCDLEKPLLTPSWQRVEVGLAPPDKPGHWTLTGIAYGNGRWLALSKALRAQTSIYWTTSEDGVTWTPASQSVVEGPAHELSRVFRVRDQFVFFAEQGAIEAPRLFVYTSPDGDSWNAQAVPFGSYVWDIASSDAMSLLAAGPTQVWRSSNLSEWQNQLIDPATVPTGVVDIGFDGSRWVASVGQSFAANGMYQGVGKAYASANGFDWQPTDLTGHEHFQLEYGGGVWFAGNLLREHRTSSDGLSFSAVEPTGLAGEPIQLGLVRYAGGRFVSYVDVYRSREIRLVASRDGATWEGLGTLQATRFPTARWPSVTT